MIPTLPFVTNRRFLYRALSILEYVCRLSLLTYMDIRRKWLITSLPSLLQSFSGTTLNESHTRAPRLNKQSQIQHLVILDLHSQVSISSKHTSLSPPASHLIGRSTTKRVKQNPKPLKPNHFPTPLMSWLILSFLLFLSRSLVSFDPFIYYY